MGYPGQKFSLCILITIILVSASIGVTEPGRAMFRAILFIPEILPNAPIRPQKWFVDDPSRQEVRFPFAGAEAIGDLYLPADDGRHPAVILFLGVAPAERDDPRVTNLATGLARSKMAVFIPWSEVMMTSRRLDPEAVDLLVEGFQYLEQHPSIDPKRIGIGGFCVGASFAALAAEDERIRDKVAYLNFFGGYYDAKDLLVAIASRTRSYGDSREPWEPRDDAREVFSIHLIEGIPNEREREDLIALFLEDGPTNEVDVKSLSKQATAVYRLLSGVTIEDARDLMTSLPANFLEDLERISPSTLIDDLQAPVLLMHDREDTAVPAAESRRMAAALKNRDQVYYTEFSLFQHMDPTRPVGPPTMIIEVWKLLLHMYNIMRLSTQ